MRIGIVGAGPAGSLLALRLAEGGAAVVVFDASHPREKPCGGGLTRKALRALPGEPATDPLPVRRVGACRFESGPRAVDVPLEEPVAVVSRRELDSWLLRRACAAGVRHVAERVVAASRGELRTAAGRTERVDLVVGADGAGSLVRRTFLGPLARERVVMAAGWFVGGTSPMLVRFLPPLAGYLWAFPRPDHVGVGICAPLGEVKTSALIARLEREIARFLPALADPEAKRYAHTIPCPSADERSILEIAGDGYALVGDAAALADPITGEGIAYALRSAAILAETLLASGSSSGYPERVLEDFGRDLLKAAALHRRFYAPGFAERMVRFSAESPAVRRVLEELVLGRQGYLGLKRRLIRAAPRFLLEAGASRILGARGSRDTAAGPEGARPGTSALGR
jgi:flavin-dependent dehydrogenase